MIAKKFRLHKEKDFSLILKSKNKFYSYNLVLRFVSNNLEQSCFAVVVSSKISKKAVERNKIRRRIFEILRLNMNKIKSGYNLVFFVKKEILEKNYQEIEKEILFLLKKAKLLI